MKNTISQQVQDLITGKPPKPTKMQEIKSVIVSIENNPIYADLVNYKVYLDHVSYLINKLEIREKRKQIIKKIKEYKGYNELDMDEKIYSRNDLKKAIKENRLKYVQNTLNALDNLLADVLNGGDWKDNFNLDRRYNLKKWQDIYKLMIEDVKNEIPELIRKRK